VPVWKKSHARIPDASEARNCRQVVTHGGARARARPRPGSAGSCPRRSGTRARGAHLGCGGGPIAGSAWPAAGPAHGSPPGWAGARWVRVGPLVLDRAPVPGEQGAGCHDPVPPQAPGQKPRQGGDHGPVRPVRLRAGGLAAQDRYLVPQHHDLRVFGCIAARCGWELLPYWEESGRSCPPGPTEQARSAPRGSAGRHCRAPRREPEACGALASGMRFSTGAARWAYGHEMITLPEHIGERGSGKPG
jgi:hypothetical protein